MNLVLDNSVAMLWLLPQSNPSGVALAERVLDSIQEGGAKVPSLWSLEAANVIQKCLRNGKISQAQASTFVGLLEALAIETDPSTAARALHATLAIAMQFRLSAYDAAYLELALRESLPLATVDDALRQAAIQAGVALVG